MVMDLFYLQAKLLELFEDTEDINGLLPELPGVCVVVLSWLGDSSINFVQGRFCLAGARCITWLKRGEERSKSFARYVQPLQASLWNRLGFPPCQGFSNLQN